MEHFELRDGFLIGHRQIDAEHAQLVSLLNACIDISNATGHKDDFYAKFLEFEEAMRNHIENEEAIMMKLGYLDADVDAGMHQKGVQVFRDLVSDCQLNIDTDIIIKQAVRALLELMLKADLGLKGYLHQIGYQEP